MKILKMFCEEVVANSWLRRPQDRNVGDVSTELEKRRTDAFEDSKQEFEVSADDMQHDIEAAESIEQLQNILDKFNCDAYDIVADPTDFDQACEKADLEAVRSQLLMGLGKWAQNSVKSAEQNGQDSFSLRGHPMRRVKGGGPSLKRSMT